MQNEHKLRVRMLRVVGDVAPLVLVDYMDKNAEEHTGLMLLDSGSMGNVLSVELADSIGELCKLKEETEIHTLDGRVVNAKKVRFSFVLGGKQFHETFSISNREMPFRVEGVQTVGILGVEFMHKHGLSIDYSDFSFHTSEVNPQNLSISDCDFFFPMEPGLINYRVPVIAFHQGGKEIVVLADSGATDNIIAKQSVVDYDFIITRTPEKDRIEGLGGSVEVEGTILKFNMLSLTEDDVRKITRHARFFLLPHYVLTPCDDLCDKTDGEFPPPVEALVGSPFMAKQGWVLDFGAKIIYRRKPMEVLKVAV